jgi:tetratricopeptide (TPR) repeat protein
VARWRIESRTAIDLYDRALALAGPEEGWGTRESRILSTRGEAMYWLGRFDEAAGSLARALDIEPDDSWTVAHASRFLGDIELNVRARADVAAELFDRALAASEDLKDPWAVARALLMGAWVPYWRGEWEAAQAMFERALEIARSNPEGDRWAEARALTSLVSVKSASAPEVECLELAREAYELGRAMRDPFTTAVAQQSIGGSYRRMLQLDEAFQHLDRATRTFHDLGARWEEASSLGDRGNVLRLQGDLEGAERDLRETIRLSQELGERSLITWTIDRLVLVLVMRREVVKARALLAETFASVDPDDPGFRETFLASETMVHLAEGDRETARERAVALLEYHREGGRQNETATTTWWVGRLFGPDAVGGEEAMERARQTLEDVGWVQFIQEPDLLLDALAQAA